MKSVSVFSHSCVNFSCQDEDSVDIKVLNLDNSDIVVLPQNCFFQLDKEGTSLPMQCVLCALEVRITIGLFIK